jgi:two-component system, OmpR family, sensor histidine kinase KdpD
MTGPGHLPGLQPSPPRSTAARYGLVAVAVVLATLAAAALEQWIGVGDASSVYLVAVVLAAAMLGTPAAVGTSVVAFLAYDFLFTTPRLTFTVADPAEWLSLLLFLIVAVVIGRLTSLVRERAEEADRRVREGVALVAISRDVAMAATFGDAAAAVAGRLVEDAEMDAVWVTDATAQGAVIARAGAAPQEEPDRPWTLMRSLDDEGSDWLRLHADGDPAEAREGGPEHYVVSIDDEEGLAGWIHATREPGAPRPGRGARRVLVLAADQLGIALRRDRLRAELTAAEVARQGDALRAAILDSVSHDLRTPIASIRALAGGLADAAVDPDRAAVRRTAAAIDAEGARLGGLVNGLLDMGRIQSGDVRPDVRPYDLAELIETTLRTHAASPGTRRPVVSIPEDLPPVLVDAVLFDVALGNVIDNATGHATSSSEVRLSASVPDPGTVLVCVDDDGPGVPVDALPHLFDRFYRVRTDHESARHGLGLGLAIARGFVEAMSGTIDAEASPLGGLGIRIRLPAAHEGQPA